MSADVQEDFVGGCGGAINLMDVQVGLVLDALDFVVVVCKIQDSLLGMV